MTRTRTRNAYLKFIRHWQLYLLALIPIMFFIIFRYVPMFGVIIAFKDYNPTLGILGSPWAGLKHFRFFFNNPNFWNIIRNTMGLGLYGLAVGFPLPIILALTLNEVRPGKFKRTVQMVTYAPYFISTVVMVSMLLTFLSPRIGFINMYLSMLGFEPIYFMTQPNMFWSIYVFSDAWQHTGYAAVIYLAALAGVDPQLYEAAKVDGASRFQRMINIDLPGILPTAAVIFVLNAGNFMAIGFEKAFLMQNPLNLSHSEVLATYVYKVGLLQANYSFAGAVGFFNSIINLTLIILVNRLAKRVSGSSLW